MFSLCLATRPPATPWEVWQGWSFAPVIVVPLILMLGLYLRAYGRSSHRDRGARIGPACFLGGWALLAVALVSPLCRMAATLAWAHMVQHVILVALAPPLLVLGVLYARPPGRRRTAGEAVAASALYAAAIWISHTPAVYQAALDDATVHVAVACGLVGAGTFFWRVALAPVADPGAAAGGTAFMALFSALLQTGVLGALLTFSPNPWYPVFEGRVEAWGLTPLEDQQLAGLIMWVPMGGIYLFAGLAAAMRFVVRDPRPKPPLQWQ